MLLGNDSRDGIIANLFQKGTSGFVMHIDGKCTEKIALPLSYVIDKGEYFSGGGKKFAFDGPKKFIIETTDLSLVSESMIAKSMVLNIKVDQTEMARSIISSNVTKFSDEETKTNDYKTMGMKLFESLKKCPQSCTDRFLRRTELKKLTETFSMVQCLMYHQKSSSFTDILIFSFLFIFGSCEEQQKKTDIHAAIKLCLTSNKDLFGDTKIPDILDEISDEVNITLDQKIVKISSLLLKAKIPTLIVGNRKADNVHKSVIRGVENQNSVFEVNFHSLSDARDINTVINKNFIKRGKSSLVPSGLREVIISATDLSTPITSKSSLPVSLLKDVSDKKSIVFKDIICKISDVNSICKVSPSAKFFKDTRAFNS